MVDKLYEHTAYPDSPFGPYEPLRAIARAGGAAVNVLSAADWILVLSFETLLFKWGQLAIDAAMSLGPAFDSNAMANMVWVEVRVVTITGGIEEIWFEGALIPARSIFSSGGPITLPFAVGEVPDRIDVYARTRQGGGLLTTADVLALDVTAASRFAR